jgi:hypothetical protein
MLDMSRLIRPYAPAPIRVRGQIRVVRDPACWVVYSHRNTEWGIGDTLGAALKDYACTLGELAALRYRDATKAAL